MKHLAGVLLTMLLAAGNCPAGPGLLVAGNDEAIWLARPSEDGKTHDLYARRIGQQWKRVLTQLTGAPVAAVAVQDDLHLIFEAGQHMVIRPDGSVQVADNLRGDFLAVCGLKGPDQRVSSALLALVRRPNPPKGSPKPLIPTTQPAGKHPTSHKPKTIKPDHPEPSAKAYRCLYRSAGSDWEPVSWYPDEMPASPPQRLRLAVVNGSAYVLEMPVAGQGKPFLRRFDGAKWTSQTLKKPPSDMPAVIALSGRLMAILHGPAAPASSQPASQPAGFTLDLAEFDPKTATFSLRQPILHNGQRLVFPSDTALGVTRLGDQIALAWREGSALRLALCSANGTVQTVEDVSEQISSLPDVQKLEDLYQYFLLGTIVLLALCMFVLRPRKAPQPFLLPPHYRPGKLLKRLAAMLVDGLPFVFLANALFVPPVGWEEAVGYLGHPETIPAPIFEGAVYAFLVSQTLYVVYGTLMEFRFGATLGKMLLRLRVVSDESQRLRFHEAALRNLTKVIELSILASPWRWFMGVLVLLPLLTRYRQRLGDMVARTAVVEVRSIAPPETPAHTLGPIGPTEDDAEDSDPT